MHTDIYWIEAPLAGRLAIASRPRAGEWLEDQIAAWRRGGIDLVVSLLEAEETSELDLRGVEQLCRKHAIEHTSFPVTDRGIPTSMREAIGLARRLSDRVADGKTVAIHCRAGIGRSGMIAASVLIVSGLDPGTALELIAKARGVAVPDTDEQRDWVYRLSEHVNAASRR